MSTLRRKRQADNGRDERGFTLVELLIVVAIIGLLASIGAVVAHASAEKARDAKRLYDVRQLANAVQLYYQEHSVFPQNPIPGHTCYYEYEPEDVSEPVPDWYSEECLSELQDSGLLSALPVSPEAGFHDAYGYYAYSASPGIVIGTHLERPTEEITAHSCHFATGSWCDIYDEDGEFGASPNAYCICLSSEN